METVKNTDTGAWRNSAALLLALLCTLWVLAVTPFKSDGDMVIATLVFGPVIFAGAWIFLRVALYSGTLLLMGGLLIAACL